MNWGPACFSLISVTFTGVLMLFLTLSEDFTIKQEMKYSNGMFMEFITDSKIFHNKADFKVLPLLLNISECHLSTVTILPLKIYVIGVNKGQLAKLLVKICPNANFRGFEADPMIYATYLENLNLTTSMNNSFKFYNIGVSEKNGVLPFYTRGVGMGLELGSFEIMSSANEFVANVSTKSLPNIMKTFGDEKIDFLIIDVEGHEGKVFKGMEMAQYCNFYPLIQVELGDSRSDYDQKQFLLKMMNLKYDIYLMGEMDFQPILQKIPYNNLVNEDCKTCLRQNVLLVKKSHVISNILYAIQNLTHKI
jgi:FkbM family methyltransferase